MTAKCKVSSEYTAAHMYGGIWFAFMQKYVLWLTEMHSHRCMRFHPSDAFGENIHIKYDKRKWWAYPIAPCQFFLIYLIAFHLRFNIQCLGVCSLTDIYIWLIYRDE